MTTDLELKHFSSPLAIFFFLNSEEKHISHKKIYYEYFLKCERIFFTLWKWLWRMLVSALSLLAAGLYASLAGFYFFVYCMQNLLPPFFLNWEPSSTTLSKVTNNCHVFCCLSSVEEELGTLRIMYDFIFLLFFVFRFALVPFQFILYSYLREIC